MAYTYPVKWITDGMRGAPKMSGTVGAMIGVLDAFLTTGWGAVAATSVSVSGGVGAANFGAGIFFEDHAVVLISGATPAILNGEARVLSHTSSTITFETNAPDGAATGTISFKYAPASNWEKAYSGTNIACYRSTAPASAGHLVRVDDSIALAARVTGYESMSDVSTGVGPFPSVSMLTGGGYWHKSANANSSSVRYEMAADELAFLVCIAAGTSYDASATTSGIRGFGSPLAMAPGGDAWSTFLSSAQNSINSHATYGSLAGGAVSGAGTPGCVMPRALSGLGSAVLSEITPVTGATAGFSGADGTLGIAPSSVDGEVKLSRLFLRDKGTDISPRAVVPGVLYIPQKQATSLYAMGDLAPGSGDFSGRKLLAAGMGTNITAPIGVGFIDATGPWRSA